MWTCRELISSPAALATSLTAAASVSPIKRQEENDKFLFRQFFRHLQGNFRDPSRYFGWVYHTYLASEFSEDEIRRYFRPLSYTKGLQKSKRTATHNSGFSEAIFWQPTVFTSQVINRLLRLGALRKELRRFMADHLIENSKEEVRVKSLALLNKFRCYFTEKNYELYINALVNSLSMSKLKVFSINDVERLMDRMNARINELENEVGED